MTRSLEPCLCGAPDCPRCFPASYAAERQWEWVNDYFPGKRCGTCPQQHVNEDDEGQCNVIEGDGEIDDCPALAEQERHDADDAAHSKWESKHDRS